jgi:glycosyltransferase involved in cell wall biosynthesis
MIKKVLEDIGKEYEIIMEEDGSTDRTGEIIKRIAKKDAHVKALSFPEKRRGIGWGLKKLFKAASGDLLITCDADLAVNPSIIKKFLTESKKADVIIASRCFEGSNYPLLRRICSKTYNLMNRLLFGIKIRDTQSGFLSLHKKVFDDIDLWFDGFVTNLEIIVKAKKAGYVIKEIPVEYSHRKESHFFLLKHGLRMMVDTIFLRLKI